MLLITLIRKLNSLFLPEAVAAVVSMAVAEEQVVIELGLL